MYFSIGPRDILSLSGIFLSWLITSSFAGLVLVDEKDATEPLTADPCRLTDDPLPLSLCLD